MKNPSSSLCKYTQWSYLLFTYPGFIINLFKSFVSLPWRLFQSRKWFFFNLQTHFYLLATLNPFSWVTWISSSKSSCRNVIFTSSWTSSKSNYIANDNKIWMEKCLTTKENTLLQSILPSERSLLQPILSCSVTHSQWEIHHSFQTPICI